MEQVRSYLQALMAVDDRPLQLEEGQILFEEGEAGTEMYVVRTGSVRLRSKSRILEEVGPGGMIGEMALIDSSPRSATAIAGPDCTLTKINEYTLHELVKKVPGLSLEIMRIMAARLRRANASPPASAAKASRPKVTQKRLPKKRGKAARK